MKDQMKIKDFVIIFLICVIVAMGIACFLDARAEAKTTSVETVHMNYGDIPQRKEVVISFNKDNDLTIVVCNGIEVPLKHDGLFIDSEGNKFSLAGYARTNDGTTGYWTLKDGEIRVYHNQNDIP